MDRWFVVCLVCVVGLVVDRCLILLVWLVVGCSVVSCDGSG